MNRSPASPTLFSMPPLHSGATPPPESLVVLGVPYDGASFGDPGACDAPRTLRSFSSRVWSCRHDLNTLMAKPTFSPAQGTVVLEGTTLLDAGDLLVDEESPEQVAELVSQQLQAWLKVGAVPLLLGGDHSVTFGAVHALSQFHQTGVIYLDAHLDASPATGGPLTHASWAGLAHALPQVHFVAQMGLRSLQPLPLDFVLPPASQRQDQAFATWGVDRVLAGSHMESPRLNQWVDSLPKDLKWHLSIDADVLDPILMPHTGMPLPLGISPHQLLQTLLLLVDRLAILSLDLVEFAPSGASAGISAMTLAGILAEVIPPLMEQRPRIGI